MKQKVLITAALPYANGPIHFGHIAGSYLPADCYARYMRLKGRDTLFICGSDEYGVAITLSADLANRTPQKQVDIFHKINSDFFKTLEISFDHYSRTTWPGHIEPSQEFFTDLLNNGYIEEKTTDQLYSEKDERFLADRYVVGACPKCGFEEARGDECPSCGASYEATDLNHPRSKLTDAPLILKPTKNWFMRFDLFKEQLSKWLGEKNWKANVKKFAKNYIDDLKPRAITRDSSWGIPVPLPNAEGKVLYVWFDAPIGYISATKEWAKENDQPQDWEKYWLDPETKYVQFLGKDNIPFHAIFFPAMVMGQNTPYKLVDELPANEFYNLEGKQFSKSSGWYIDLEDFFTHFTSEQIRYTIAANAPETQDSEFTWKDFQMRCNSELLGKYGNLINRVLVFAKNKCDGKIPPLGSPNNEDQDFLKTIQELTSQAAQSYESFHLRKATQIIMELAQAGNAYFDSKKPWVLAKNEATQQEMFTVINCCMQCIKALMLISSPILPKTANKVAKFLGEEKILTKHTWDEIAAYSLPENESLPTPEILFKKVEDDLIEELILKLKSAGSSL